VTCSQFAISGVRSETNRHYKWTRYANKIAADRKAPNKTKAFFSDEGPEQPEQQPQRQQNDDPGDEPEVVHFRINIFYHLIDAVILGLTTRSTNQ